MYEFCIYLPILQVNIGNKKYKIDTPIRKVAVKKYTRKSYPSFCKAIVQSEPKNMVHAVSKEIQQELSQMCSTKQNSVLMTDGENIRSFSWNTVWLELQQQMPIFSSLLNAVESKGNQILQCVIACVILKNKYQKLSLLQKIISTFFYANAVPKQV